MEATVTSPAANTTLHEDSLPSLETPDELVAFIEDGCTAILHSASDFRAQGQLPYINMYSAINRYLVGERAQQKTSMHARGGILVQLLRRVLTSHLTDTFNKRPKQDTQGLVAFYVLEWLRYIASAKLLDRVFLYFCRHYIRRERDEGNIAIQNVYDYCMCIWKKTVVEMFHEDITDGCVKMVMSSDGDVSAAKTVTDSLVALRFKNPEKLDTENAVYEEYLAKPILAAVRLDAARNRADALHEEDTIQDQRKSAMKARFEACLLPATVEIIVHICDDAAGLDEQNAKGADNDL